MVKPLELTVNGRRHELAVKPNTLLVEVLASHLGLQGVKRGCDCSSCGACTVIIDGRAVKSCSILAVQANGKEVTTIEGLADGNRLDPMQQAFIDNFAIQCGYCTPGMILSAKALLDENPHPTENEIKETVRGNLCRCTGYVNIVKAVMAARDRMRD